MSATESRLIIFLKAPRVGTVKTRLAVSLGKEEACMAYQRLVERLVSALTGIEEVELRFTPDDARAEIEHWSRPKWQAAGQGDGDLGARLELAFREAFARSAGRVVVIGSDCPEVTVDDICTAWKGLDSNDVVLGPATDGGYWLIGLRAPQPALFSDIAWSTGSVLRETLDHCRVGGLSVQMLRELSDVDTEEDWTRFLEFDQGT